MCSQEERGDKKIKTKKHTGLWPENPSRGRPLEIATLYADDTVSYCINQYIGNLFEEKLKMRQWLSA